MTLGTRVSPIVERVISQRRRCGEELLEQAEAENVSVPRGPARYAGKSAGDRPWRSPSAASTLSPGGKPGHSGHLVARFQRKCSSGLRSSLLFFDRLTVSLLISRSDRTHDCRHHFSSCTLALSTQALGMAREKRLQSSSLQRIARAESFRSDRARGETRAWQWQRAGCLTPAGGPHHPGTVV